MLCLTFVIKALKTCQTAEILGHVIQSIVRQLNEFASERLEKSPTRHKIMCLFLLKKEKEMSFGTVKHFTFWGKRKKWWSFYAYDRL